jgi:hypothetical protein
MDVLSTHRIHARPEPRASEPLLAPESPAAWLTSGHEAQVFVDDSGRRARRVRLAGFALACACAFWLAALTLGMVGFAGFPARLPTLAHKGIARPAATRRDQFADLRETASTHRALVYVADAGDRPRCPSSRPGSHVTAAHTHTDSRRAPRAACASAVDHDPRLT